MASAYAFCAALGPVLPEASHSTSVAFPLVQDTRPISADWPALAVSSGSWIYFVAQIQYALKLLPLCCSPAACVWLDAVLLAAVLLPAASLAAILLAVILLAAILCMSNEACFQC